MSATTETTTKTVKHVCGHSWVWGVAVDPQEQRAQLRDFTARRCPTCQPQKWYSDEKWTIRPLAPVAAPAPVAPAPVLPPVAISGATYPVRHEIAALGGHWDAAARAWLVPANRADEARALVAAQAAWVCDECGAELSRPFCPSCRDEMFIRQVR